MPGPGSDGGRAKRSRKLPKRFEPEPDVVPGQRRRREGYAKTACDRCKELHSKCGQERPCIPCVEAGARCTQGGHDDFKLKGRGPLAGAAAASRERNPPKGKTHQPRATLKRPKVSHVHTSQHRYDRAAEAAGTARGEAGRAQPERELKEHCLTTTTSTTPAGAVRCTGASSSGGDAAMHGEGRHVRRNRASGTSFSVVHGVAGVPADKTTVATNVASEGRPPATLEGGLSEHVRGVQPDSTARKPGERTVRALAGSSEVHPTPAGQWWDGGAHSGPRSATGVPFRQLAVRDPQVGQKRPWNMAAGDLNGKEEPPVHRSGAARGGGGQDLTAAQHGMPQVTPAGGACSPPLLPPLHMGSLADTMLAPLRSNTPPAAECSGQRDRTLSESSIMAASLGSPGPDHAPGFVDADAAGVLGAHPRDSSPGVGSSSGGLDPNQLLAHEDAFAAMQAGITPHFAVPALAHLPHDYSPRSHSPPGVSAGGVELDSEDAGLAVHGSLSGTLSFPQATLQAWSALSSGPTGCQWNVEPVSSVMEVEMLPSAALLPAGARQPSSSSSISNSSGSGGQGSGSSGMWGGRA
jgi:hypothetical protein